MIVSIKIRTGMMLLFALLISGCLYACNRKAQKETGTKSKGNAVSEVSKRQQKPPTKRLFILKKGGKLKFQLANALKFLNKNTFILSFPPERARKSSGFLANSEIEKTIKEQCRCNIVSTKWIDSTNLKITTNFKKNKKALLKRLALINLIRIDPNVQCNVNDDCTLFSIKEVCCSVCKDKVDLASGDVKAIGVKEVNTAVCHRVKRTLRCFCDISDDIRKRNLRYRAICKNNRCIKSLQ